MPDNDQERTEKATPKKRQDARKKGQVPTSRDVSSAILILTVVVAFKYFGVTLFRDLKILMTQGFQSLSFAAMTEATFSGLMQNGLASLFMILVPIVGLMTLVGACSVIFQHGILWTTEPITPQFSRIDPISGVKRLFSLNALVNLAKTFLKFLVIGWISYFVIRRELPDILTMSRLETGNLLTAIGAPISRLILWTGFVVAMIGAVDYGYQWWEHERKLRMSRQEMKEELKQAEGTPLVRSRVRSLQREMARKRMMADVPKADVVVTNPTRLAVALRYRAPEMAAPKVIAKGAGYLAQKIREIAQENDIPIVENKPVAQTLFKSVQIGREIPGGIYRAVAEILAYVYKLRSYKGAS
ncbi:MAG: flagellar biosynthesis protein FlhB [Nitrospiria bacterium]